MAVIAAVGIPLVAWHAKVHVVVQIGQRDNQVHVAKSLLHQGEQPAQAAARLLDRDLRVRQEDAHDARTHVVRRLQLIRRVCPAHRIGQAIMRQAAQVDADEAEPAAGHREVLADHAHEGVASIHFDADRLQGEREERVTINPDGLHKPSVAGR